MDPIKIPAPSELPQSPDPLNLIRQKVADEIQRSSVYQKHASVVFKQDPLLCTEKWVNFRYKNITWNLDMFEKIAIECRKMGYLKVEVKEKIKTVMSGQYGVGVSDRVVMYISWDDSSM